MNAIIDTTPESFVFISYTSADQRWATWIASVLESAGLTVRIQAWDSPPGKNFVLWMQEQLTGARWTVALYSTAYFDSKWCTIEWTTSLAQQTLLPLRIEPVEPPPTLANITWVDLFGLDESYARQQVLRAVEVEVLPRLAQGFPPSTTPAYPGPSPTFGQKAEPVRAFDLSSALERSETDLTADSSLKRLAAVHTLESIATARDSAPTVALIRSLLAAHVRSKSSKPDDRVAAIFAISRLPSKEPIDLRNADLTRANLIECDLENVDLRGAKLSNARMIACNLRDATLDSADLDWADLSQANLTRASLSAARLSGTGFRGATLDGALLSTSSGTNWRLFRNARYTWTTQWNGNAPPGDYDRPPSTDGWYIVENRVIAVSPPELKPSPQDAVKSVEPGGMIAKKSWWQRLFL